MDANKIFGTLLLAAAQCMAAAPPCAPASVEPQAALAVLEVGSLRDLTSGKKALAESEGPGYAVAWPDETRALVLLRGEAKNPVLVSFDRLARAAAQCEGVPAGSRLVHTRLPAIERFGTTLFLNVFQLAGADAPVESILAVDFAGVRAGRAVVVFPREGDHPRSVSFESTGEGALQYLITGLSGGTWEIWCNGWLMDPGLAAEPGGTLSFEGTPGSYFIRRR